MKSHSISFIFVALLAVAPVAQADVSHGQTGVTCRIDSDITTSMSNGNRVYKTEKVWEKRIDFKVDPSSSELARETVSMSLDSQTIYTAADFAALDSKKDRAKIEAMQAPLINGYQFKFVFTDGGSQSASYNNKVEILMTKILDAKYYLLDAFYNRGGTSVEVDLVRKAKAEIHNIDDRFRAVLVCKPEFN